MPGASSTPDDTSIPYGRTRATASPTFSGVKPPARRTGRLAATRAARSQSIGRPVPPCCHRGVRVQEQQNGCRPWFDRVLERDAFHDRSRQRGRGSGRFPAVQLHGAETNQTCHPGNVFHRLIDEHAHRRHEWRQQARDGAGPVRVDAPWTSRPEDEADGRRPCADGRLRILAASDAADLHDHERSPRAPRARSMATTFPSELRLAARNARSSSPGSGMAMNRSPIRNAR